MPSDILIANRYQLAELLGSGAMGDVYRATDTQTNQTVAVKTLKPDLVAANPDLLTRFQREGEALRDLNHPNIVSLLDVVSEDDGHYLVMEYISGGDLAGLLTDAPGGLPIEHALNIALDLADALTRAHRLDIIHRDLKPANVLIAEDGTPRLSDFGIAHVGGVDSLTDSSNIMGTLYYLPPEACMGQSIDQRADIWALGVVLFEMLTGSRPFNGESAAAVISAILNDPFPDPQELRPDASDDLNDLIYRMLEKDRDGRMPSVRLIGAAIEAMMRGLDYPHAPAATIPDLTEESLFDTPAPDTGQGRHNLPSQATPFVGREGELAHLADQLTDPDLRLITILGPGGMGKSRLSIETGNRLTTEFRDGVFFVELAKLNDPANIPTAIGEAADYPFSEDGTPRQQILQFLGNKHMLLILDNFEHLLGGTDLVADMIKAAPEVTILATSRIRLNLSGETIFNLDPMEYPEWETPEDALRYSAVQLFMQSAKRTQINFELQQDDLTYLTRICRLVEGMPLGILLAAAWVDMLSLEEIAAEMVNSLDFLASEMTDLPERQRSMRAAIDYSWRLLGEEERAAFARMSVFRGGCTRKAAQAVSETSIRMLTLLANKSFLRRDQETGRFEIHELLRQYAEEYLDAQGESQEIRDAHMNYYLPALAGKEEDLKGGDQLTALNDIEIDFENVRAAWTWAVERENLAGLSGAVEALGLYCDMRSRFVSGQEMMEVVRRQVEGGADDESRHLWAWATVQHEMMGVTGRQLADRVDDIQRALEIARKAGDRKLEGCGLYLLGWVHQSQERPEQAAAQFDESAAVFEAAGEAYYQALALHYVSYAYWYQGDTTNGLRVLEQAVAIRRAVGDRSNLARSLMNMGVIEGMEGNRELEIKYYQESMAVAQSTGNLISLIWSKFNLCMDYLYNGQIDEGRRLADEALVLAQQISHPRTLAHVHQSIAVLALIDADYEKAEALAKEVLALNVADMFGTGGPALFFLVEAAFGRGDYELAARRFGTLMREAQSPNRRVRVGQLLLKAFFYAYQGDHERAAELLGLSQSLPGRVPIEDAPFPHFQRLVGQLRESMGEDEFRVALARGEAMDLDQVYAAEFEEYLHDDDR